MLVDVLIASSLVAVVMDGLKHLIGDMARWKKQMIVAGLALFASAIYFFINSYASEQMMVAALAILSGSTTVYEYVIQNIKKSE